MDLTPSQPLAPAASARQGPRGEQRRIDARSGVTRGAPRHHAALYALLAPYLWGVAVLVLLPGVLALALSLTEFDALAAPRWRGLGNFRELFEDQRFWIAGRNTLLFVVLAVPLRVLAALGLALLLSGRRRGVGALRATVYLPTIIPDAAYALIWLWILNPLYGPLNLLLSALGLPAPAWLVEGSTARLALVLMAGFQLGEGLVVLLAGRQAIDGEHYQAAAVDGAGGWQTFRHVTLPLLAPWLLLLTIRDIILCAQSTLTPALLMTGGGPYYETWFMPQMIYQLAFDQFRYGLGAALMVLFFLGVGLLLVLAFYLLRGWGYDDAV